MGGDACPECGAHKKAAREQKATKIVWDHDHHAAGANNDDADCISGIGVYR